MTPGLSPETLAAQALGETDGGTGALSPPIHPSTIYERAPDGTYRSGLTYTRADNPTYDHAERLLTRLEGGAGCMLFGSGMAATTAIFQSLLPGDHVVVSRILYWGVRRWLAEFAVTWGLDVEFVDTTDLARVQAAMRPGRTRLLYVETPSNPMWDITDIAAASAIAHGADARVAVDSTAASPVLTRPIELGADLVVHSATKYLNGHSDVLAGAIVTARADSFWERIRSWRRSAGTVLGPFEAWLLQRGMRTLFVRVRRSSETALAIAQHVERHPALKAVLYPGLPSHPGHDIARRQMVGGFSGMLSLRVAGGQAEAMAVAGAVRVFKRAVSLGGVESLIEHRLSTEGPSSPVPDDLLRLSIGLEARDDLVADLEAALDGIARAGAMRAPVPPAAAAGDVATIVEMQIAPLVLARGGTVRLLSTDDGVVTLEVGGSPGAAAPLAARLPAMVREAAPGVQEVRVLGPGGTARTASDAGDVARRIRNVLDHEINPAVAEHGGRIDLVGVDDGRVRIRLEGGCQGCALAEVTVRQGVERLLRDRVPGVTAVVDVTDHGSGTSPHFAPGKR